LYQLYPYSETEFDARKVTRKVTRKVPFRVKGTRKVHPEIHPERYFQSERYPERPPFTGQKVPGKYVSGTFQVFLEFAL
jgi:hypothetical protein